MKLSAHFTFAEMTATAVRQVPNVPSEEEVENLTFLAMKVLEPTRSQFGPLYTTSGFRSPQVNKIIGGSPSSMHMKGCAWDGVPIHEVKWSDVVAYLSSRKDLPIDQVIYEFGRWIHIGTRPGGQGCRHQMLMIFTPGRYELWNPQDPRVLK